MPISSEPVAQLVLSDIAATLALIAGAPSYFSTVRKVLVPGFTPFSANEYPAIAIVPEGTTDDQTEIHYVQATRWDLTIIGILSGRDAVPLSILRLVRDIHFALMLDPRRGNTAGNAHAVDTKWLGWTPIPPADDADELAFVECRIQVVFRTSDTDMTVQA